MARIFNSIRKSLLDEGKLSKYLRYALGEIILVVLGILIALQINNWNEQRKLLAQEQDILKILTAEYQYNLEELVRNIDKGHRYIANTDSLLACLGSSRDETCKRSFGKWVSRLGAYTSFDPSNGALNDLIGSGRLSLIRNDSLRIHLSNWDGHVQDVKEDEIRLMDLGKTYLIPILLEGVVLSPTSQFTADPWEFFQSLQNENVIHILRRGMAYQMETNYPMLDREINTILKFLRQEIQ